jgi:hypothetical protein
LLVAVEPEESQQTLVVLAAVAQAPWWCILHSVCLALCLLSLVLVLLKQQRMIEVQMEALQASALLLQSVVAVAVTGVITTPPAKVRCLRAPKSQVPMVVLVVVLVVVFLIH